MVKKGIIKRCIILSGVVLMFFVISIGFFHEQLAAKEKLVIKIGVQPVILPELITQSKGILEKKYKNKYEISWIEFTHAGPGIEAMAAGEIDFLDAGVMPLIQGREKGRDYWAVGNSIGNVTGMVIRKDPGIKGLKDLKGKKVSYPGAGSWQYAILLMALEKGGLTIKDVELHRARFPEMPILMKKKSVDAFVGVEPFLSLSIVEGDAEMGFRPADELSGFFVVRPAFAKSNPEAVTNVLAEFHETSKWIKSHPEEAAEEYAKVFKGAIKKEVILYAIKNGLTFMDDIVPTYDHWIKFINSTNSYELTKIADIETFVKDFIHPEFAKKVRK